MKKQNKYRFYEKPSKEYIYDIDALSKNPSVSIEKVLLGTDPLIIPEQCMSKKDKNGAYIYEGDILMFLDENNKEHRFICEFGTFLREIKGYDVNEVEITGFCFRSIINDRATFPMVRNRFGKHDLEILTIIGNINENPELIKNI